MSEFKVIYDKEVKPQVEEIRRREKGNPRELQQLARSLQQLSVAVPESAVVADAKRDLRYFRAGKYGVMFWQPTEDTVVVMSIFQLEPDPILEEVPQSRSGGTATESGDFEVSGA